MTTSTQGGETGGYNSSQYIYPNVTTGGGTYNITFSSPLAGYSAAGVTITTSNLNWNVNAAQLQAALEVIPSIGTGNVVVTGDYDTGFRLTFTGSLRNQLVATAVATVPTGRSWTVGVLRAGSSAFFLPIYHTFVNNFANTDVYDEYYTTLGGSNLGAGPVGGSALPASNNPAFVFRGVSVAGVNAVTESAGALVLANDNALGIGGVSLTASALWAYSDEPVNYPKRMVNRYATLTATEILGGKREWGGNLDVWLPGAMMTAATVIEVDDPEVDAKIGFVNEVQSINTMTNATAGSWSLTFNGSSMHCLQSAITTARTRPSRWPAWP